MSPGLVLEDRYQLASPIASGGMGDVWRAQDLVLGRTVAVKILRPDLVADPGFGARFRAEARMMAALRHPGVVEVYDYGESTGPDGANTVYLVMPFVDGEPLSTRLAAGPLGLAETESVITQAAYALQAAHDSGIVHRDVKPGNLLIQPNGTVQLVDFGVARAQDITSATGDVVGTALYMAPEQVTKGEITAATDVYALGAVAYHCLAGQPPFRGENPIEVALRHLDTEPAPLPEQVPPPVRAVVSRALAKEPADRYPSATAFAEALTAATGPGAALDATQAIPLPPSIVDYAPGPAGPLDRRPAAGAAVAIALVMLLGLAALLFALVNRDPDQPQQQDPGQRPPASAEQSTAGPGRTSSRPAGPASPVATGSNPPVNTPAPSPTAGQPQPPPPPPPTEPPPTTGAPEVTESPAAEPSPTGPAPAETPEPAGATVGP